MNSKWFIDAAERVVATFVEAFVGLIVVSGQLDVSTAEKAAAAGVIAAAAFVKTLVAKFLTANPNSASLAPAVAKDATPVA